MQLPPSLTRHPVGERALRQFVAIKTPNLDGQAPNALLRAHPKLINSVL
ncbi:hypothetical protein [Streptomyces sp. NPDC051994]